MIAFGFWLLREVGWELVFGFQQAPQTWTDSEEILRVLDDAVYRLERGLCFSLHPCDFQCLFVELAECRKTATCSHRFDNRFALVHAAEIIMRLALSL